MDDRQPRLWIGLTGGIASGKSTVGKLFEDRGAAVIDADAAAHDILAPGSDGLKKVVSRFGAEFLNPDGSLDRAALRRLVFSDAQERKALEAITHPLIMQEIQRRITRARGLYLILMIPLLIETGRYKGLVQRILVVDTPEELQIERLMARDGVSEEQAWQSLRAQSSRTQRLEIADDVIVNDCAIEALTPQVVRLHEQYISLSRQ